MRGWHEAPSGRKAPALGAEVDDRGSVGPGWRETPTLSRNLVRAVFEPPNDRSFVGRPDVFARLEIWGGAREPDGYPTLAECREVVAVGDVIAEIVAHISYSPDARWVTTHVDRRLIFPLAQINDMPEQTTLTER